MTTMTTKPIHIEGMGIPGCLLALLLHRRGIDFTWHDTGETITAWRASTGAIYPSTSTKFGNDDACRLVWEHWHAIDLTDGCTEQAVWTYSQKSAPHGSKYQTRQLDCGLRQAIPFAYHLNAQALVPKVRDLFADKRTDGEPAHVIKIVSHGFGVRRSHSYWGWTRLVELDYADEIKEANSGLRPTFYFREGRVVMAYAYPIPGTRFWYAGSNIIKQKLGKERSLEMPPKYDTWKDRFLRLGGGNVSVVDEDDFIEGWRPACGDLDWVTREGDVIHMRPLWNSGIRHFPQQWDGVLAHLGLPKMANELVTS